MRGDFDINSTWRSGRVVIVSLRRDFNILTQKRFSLFRFFNIHDLFYTTRQAISRKNPLTCHILVCSGKKNISFFFFKKPTQKKKPFFFLLTAPHLFFTAKSSFLPCFRYVHEHRGGIAISTTIVSALMRERYPVCSS